MKKKLYVMLITVLLSFTVVACGKGNLATGETETGDSDVEGITESSVADLTALPTESVQQAEDTGEADVSNYYGIWEVTTSVTTAPVYALSQEEIDSFIGSKVSYAVDSVSVGDFVYQISETDYTEEPYLAERLVEDYGVKLGEMDITRDELLAVDVVFEDNAFGSHFFVMDNEKLLIYYEGVFFEAVRVAE